VPGPIGATGATGSTGTTGATGAPGTARVVAYPYAASITIDLGTTDVALVGALTGNVVIGFMGGYDGQVCRVRLPQDSVGGRLVTFAANVKFSTTIPSFTASVAASVADYIAVVYYAAASKYHFISYTVGY
jgi:hypothetical protein